MNARSRGTTMGMRRWWAGQPRCLGCRKTKIRNVHSGMICSKCKKKSAFLKKRLKSGASAIVVFNPTPNIKEQRKRRGKRFSGQLYRLSSQHISGFEFQLECTFSDIYLMDEDFEIVE